jgi:hypothetical protein
MVRCAALLIQAVNIIAFRGTAQLVVTVAIAIRNGSCPAALYMKRRERGLLEFADRTRVSGDHAAVAPPYSDRTTRREATDRMVGGRYSAASAG